MTAPVALPPPAVTTYTRLLRLTRARALTLGQGELVRIAAVMRTAATDLEQLETSASALTRDRARGLRRELLAILQAVEAELAQHGQRAVARTLQEIVAAHRSVTPAIAAEAGVAVPAGVGARFDAVPRTVLQVLAQRRGTARTYRTLVHRHLEEAAPALDRVVEAGILRGQSARELARAVAAMLRGGRPANAAFDLPRLGGLRSIESDARMIARTEIMNALREATLASMRAARMVAAAHWQVSGAHPADDECDVLAETDRYGYGPGNWPLDRWPLAPHPNCGCYAAAVVMRPVAEWGTPFPPTSDPGPWHVTLPASWTAARRASAMAALRRATGAALAA